MFEWDEFDHMLNGTVMKHCTGLEEITVGQRRGSDGG